MRQRLDEQSDHAAGAERSEHRESGPEPKRAAFVPGLGDRLREWVDWFGLTRLVTSAAAVVVVGLGAWFLVRTPPPPSEASLPMAEALPTSTISAVSSSSPDLVGADTTPASGPIVVHVAGAVGAPGVYELEGGSRVDDAVRQAGGTTARADPAQLNLAAPVADGDRIYVPEVGEVVSTTAVPAGATATGGAAATSGPVDVNRAGVAELDGLPGIGPATAAAIVNDRDLNGPFAAVEDLERVPGIGPAKLAALAGLVTT